MKLQYKFSDPLVVTREFDLAYMLLWALYAWWGIQAIITRIPTISIVSDNLYEIMWAAGISTFSLIALFFSGYVYFRTKLSQVLKKRIELYAVIILIGFIAVYPLSATILAFHGDPDRLASAVIAYTFLVFPLLRVRHLNRRIKQYVSE
jgi:hypothetical protein